MIIVLLFNILFEFDTTKVRQQNVARSNEIR